MQNMFNLFKPSLLKNIKSTPFRIGNIGARKLSEIHVTSDKNENHSDHELENKHKDKNKDKKEMATTQQESKRQKSMMQRNRGVRFDPVRFFDQEINRSISILDNLLSSNFQTNLPVMGYAPPQLYKVPIDVIERESDFLVKAELPGMEKENFSIHVENKLLSISGEKKHHKEADDDANNFHYEETYRGSFNRVIQLPKDADENSIDAKYKNGVLELTIKKLPEEKRSTKNIPVMYS